jgi:hypothetical protein
MKRSEKAPESAGEVRISPQVREFEGQKWLPVARDANVVRVKGRLFLIRGITFGKSLYKQAAKARPVAYSK